MNSAFDQDIIRRCQQGDIHAYKMVYDHFEQPLLRLGIKMLGQQEDAEDAVQTTFLRLYRSIGQFNFDSKFGTYLYRIMVNVCLDMKKKDRSSAFGRSIRKRPVPSTGARFEVAASAGHCHVAGSYAGLFCAICNR